MMAANEQPQPQDLELLYHEIVQCVLYPGEYFSLERVKPISNEMPYEYLAYLRSTTIRSEEEFPVLLRDVLTLPVQLIYIEGGLL